jgi:6,7-dimethyl-8-ribityllumazine synthase
MTQSNILHSKVKSRPSRFGIVVGQYNREFTDVLLESARGELVRLEADCEVDSYLVPGAFEIPLIIQMLAMSKRYQALLALGVIIRGETAHADLIGSTVTDSLMRIGLEFSLPIIHEVLLVNSEDQARQRVKGGEYDRGVEAAQAAVKMVRLVRDLNK